MFELAPAIRATNIAPASATRSGGRGITTGRDRFGLRRILVIAQVSLSLVLLVGAFRFVRSLQKLMGVQPGFRAEGIVSVNLDLRPGHYSKERLPLAYRDVLDRLRERTGAISVAQCGRSPVSDTGWDETTWSDETKLPHVDVLYNRTWPGYVKTMEVGLSLWAARAATAMLYDLKPYDPVTLGGAVLLLATVALIASYGPAYRASRLDPMDALRSMIRSCPIADRFCGAPSPRLFLFAR